jgi:hypothetical protein
MALARALCCVVHSVTGFTNESLRGLVAGLLSRDYTTNQMTYDLRRLRLHGLIERVPHTKTYIVTAEGLRVAVFYAKVHRRLLGPLLEAHGPPGPPRAEDDRPGPQRLHHQRSHRDHRLNSRQKPVTRSKNLVPKKV